MSAVAEPAAHDPGARRGDGRGPRRLAVVALVGGVAVAATVVALLGPFDRARRPPTGVADNGYPTGVATVERRTLASRKAVGGTLGYAGHYSVVNRAAGALTWLPSAGRLIRRGQAIYRVDGRPVVLLYGHVPAFRELKLGMTGRDVRQLNRNLVALGYATGYLLDPASAYFSAATKYSLQRLQAALAVKQTGTLRLGQAVFLPRRLRIARVTATLGTSVTPGAVVAEASSSTRRVVVDLDAQQQTSVRPSDRVAITLPNGRTVSGVVTAVGKVASTQGASNSPTVSVYIAPRDPRATGTWDKASVRVQITTSRAKHALVVPVDALVALAGGGYAVETTEPGRHRLIRVTLGLFDDADGLVQVRGTGLSAGQRILVPAS